MLVLVSDVVMCCALCIYVCLFWSLTDEIIPETDEFVALWKKVVNAGPVQTSDGYSTVGDVPWLDLVKRLYVRPCYLALKEKIIGHLKSVLVLGTPGIGKSLFLRWLLVAIARDNLDNTKPHISFRVKFADKDFYCTTASDTVKVFKAQLGTPNYYFSDSIDISEYGLSSELTMLVSSDDAAHYKEWEKKVKAHNIYGGILVMPVFDWSEINLVAPMDMNPVMRQFRFDVINVFGKAMK